MALTYSTRTPLGSQAPDFHLLDTSEVMQSLRDFRNAKVLVIVFICNHCPYVKAVRGRIQRLAAEGAEYGVQVVAINSNDSVRYPDDSFAAMRKEVAEQGYTFPYLWDETQAVARAYDAVCTPDFYVYKNETHHKDPVVFTLKYRGRLDDNWKDESAVKTRDLRAAVDEILAGRDPNPDQVPSMGCSIKWK
jgi:peroxiredoxin